MERAITAQIPEIDSGQLARDIVDLLADRKASDILLLDIRGQSIIADYFVICTGTSDRQIRALTDHVQEALGLLGVKPTHVEGRVEGRWVVMDYSSVLVHLFTAEERAFYRLEELWKDGVTVARIQ